jgi:hypothetical protein
MAAIYLLDDEEDVDFNNSPDSTSKPHASQKLTSRNLKMLGISQFQSTIVGNAQIAPSTTITATITTPTPRYIKNFSIILPF